MAWSQLVDGKSQRPLSATHRLSPSHAPDPAALVPPFRLARQDRSTSHNVVLERRRILVEDDRDSSLTAREARPTVHACLRHESRLLIEPGVHRSQRTAATRYRRQPSLTHQTRSDDRSAPMSYRTNGVTNQLVRGYWRTERQNFGPTRRRALCVWPNQSQVERHRVQPVRRGPSSPTQSRQSSRNDRRTSDPAEVRARSVRVLCAPSN